VPQKLSIQLSGFYRYKDTIYSVKLLLENWKDYLEEAEVDEAATKCWDGYTRKGTKKKGNRRVPNCVPLEEDALDEKKKKKKKKKKAKKDACYNKVKSRYKVWPSAYASGALVKCRKVGAKNWGNKSKKNEQTELFEGEETLESKIRKALIEEGGAAGMKALKDHTKASEKEIKDAIKGMSDVGLHEDGDYILQDDEEIDVKKTLDEKKKSKGGKKDGKGASSKGYTLRDWFKGDGWVQTGGKYDGKPCAKQPGQKTKPYCRDPDDRAKLSKKERDKRAAKKRKEDPNPDRKGKAKNVSQKKKAKKENRSMTKNELYRIISEEVENVLRLQESNQEYYEVAALDESEEYCPVCVKTMDEAKKKPCKPSKGKRFAKRVDGKCRSYGQAGQAKSGGDRIRPGTKKGDAYCARSAGIKKCKNPPCANTLSRKKWKCRGKKSMKEE